jgi:hypothetical protein
VSTTQRNGARILAVPSHLTATLREQTLAVLEFNHHPFEDLRELPASEQLAAAATFRDAFAVLDALGWFAPAPADVDVPLTSGHITHLHACHRDLQQSIHDRLSSRDHLTSVDTLHAITSANATDRQAADDLFVILSAWEGSAG